MTLPSPDIIVDEPDTTPLFDDDDEAIAENYRHIVCFLCYPAFATQRVAPHDAECICGKPVHAGDTPGPDNAPECVLCSEMAEAHYARVHARR